MVNLAAREPRGDLTTGEGWLSLMTQKHRGGKPALDCGEGGGALSSGECCRAKVEEKRFHLAS